MVVLLQLAVFAARVAAVQLTPESAVSPELATELAGRAEFAPEAFARCGVSLGLGVLRALPGPPGAPARLLAAGTLFGGGVGPFRSVALLSEDSGRTWREVMTPVGGSAVSEVFTRGEEVWALVAFEVEGPGPVEIVHSADAGRTWATLATVKKREPLGVVRGLEFTDAKNGRLMVDFTGMGTEPPYEVQVTEDGGKTWRVRDPAPRPANAVPAPALTADAFMLQWEGAWTGANTVSADAPVRATDGADWRLGPSAGVSLVIERRAPGRPAWRAVTRLPGSWSRTPAGKLVPCSGGRGKPVPGR